MLAVFLTVLKIIGIVLLVILALVLLILLLVLFVPIRYRLDYSVPRTNLDEGFEVEQISVKAGFSWLLHLISGQIDFPTNKQFIVKVFGIKVFPAKEKKNDSDKKDIEKPKEGVIEMSNMEDKPVACEQDAPKQENNSFEKIEDKTEDEIKEDKQDDIYENEDKSFLDVIWKVIDTIENIIETPQNVFEKIQYTTSRVCGKISMVKTTLENDIFKRAFSLVKSKLLRIIKMILPDKMDVDLVLGTGDPAATAELMSVYGIMYPLLYNKVRFEPDFEGKVLCSEGHIKGHITLFVIVYSVAVCYFNKDVKKVIRRFKKIIKA